MPTPSTTDQLPTSEIYDDALNPNWSLANSQDTIYNIAEKDIVQNGQLGLKVKPLKGFGTLFFSVRKDAKQSYENSQVLGIRFWLNSGENTIATSDLAVAVIGSNQYAYWVANDQSVQINATITAESPLFSETKLYFLGINRAIPPHNWVEVDVWLDNLIYDPPYKYITGFYIKNDETFLGTFYLDHMDLLLKP